MTKHSRSQGFAHVFLVVGLVVALIGAIGFIFWQNFILKEPTMTGTVMTTQSKKDDNKYAGWEMVTLKYEKISFKYPGSWQINEDSRDENATGGTAAPGADSILLTSPTGMVVSIETGAVGVDSSGVTMVLPNSIPINTLGDSYYLVYYTNKAQSSTDARGACLNKTNTSSGMPSFASKNIQMAGIIDGPARSTANLVCIGYQMENNVTPVKPISAFEQDASYNYAKLIIESLTY